MPVRQLPDLCPEALARLVAGMTPNEVEAIIGRYQRPNVYQGSPYYAWIADGGMLRACFDGPGGTLSSAILDVAEAQRVLYLGRDRRRRKKNGTVIRTWHCIGCRKRYRDSALPPLKCPVCRAECEYVTEGIAVPSPRRIKLWDEFWVKYKAERALLDAYAAGKLRESVRLEIFGIELKGKRKRKPPGGAGQR